MLDDEPSYSAKRPSGMLYVRFLTNGEKLGEGGRVYARETVPEMFIV